MPGGTVRWRAIQGVVARAADGDGQDGDGEVEAGTGGQLVQGAAQGRLGQLAGHEEEVRSLHSFRIKGANTRREGQGRGEAEESAGSRAL